MLPHPYALDSLSKSQDIASSILTATSSSQISTIIASIEAFLKSHSPDQSRHFFSLTFPTLICKLFGFDHSNSSSNAIGWIDTVNSSNDSHLSNLLFSLLSPNGPLFNSISAVDRLSLVKYVFPLERLPEWSRYLLCNNKDDSSVLSDLCALFRDKVKHDCQIQLNVFEYYFLWFAYYPVCKGNSEALGPVSVKRDRRFRLENWTGLLNANKRGVERKIECDLYARLLYAYLRAFVPVYDVNSHQPYRGSLLHYYPLGYEGSGMVRGEFLVDAFVHFWLVDNDFSPLPVNVCKSFGISFPLRSVLGEMPPTSGLGEVVKLFVRYLNCSAISAIEGHEGGEYCGSPRLGTNGSLDTPKSKEVTSRFSSACLLGYWNPWMQRPLYRFLLRTFLFCPVATSVKNASQVFDVWISYMEPWARNSDDFSELDVITNGPATNERKENSLSRAGVYTPQWQDYVVSNYLYYSSLVMHFIGFAHRFLHSDVEIIVQMVLKVLDTLTSSKELIDLLKNVDTLFHSKQAGSSKSMANNLYRYIPIIREQLQRE